jgi:cyclopropane-fatty-acyl-phospholipid synthase
MSEQELEPLGVPELAHGDEAARRGDAQRPRSSRVTALERRMASKLLDFVGDLPVVVSLWNGEEVGSSRGAPVMRIGITDRSALYKLAARPDLQFGDLYCAGRITLHGDLVRFLEGFFVALQGADRRPLLARLLSGADRRPRAQSLARSRANIHHHYDIGNDFYALWLDREAMQYTCAYYPSPGLTLEAAQRAKMRHVCLKLGLQAGESVVEAGSGWGGLACFMAREFGVRVRSFNTSHEQVVHSRERAEREGLTGQVEFVEDDYRNILGEYDAFVSVGMLEHVGPGHYRELGEVVDRSLSPQGRGLIHSIGRNRPAPLNAWITKRIFPGAYPPTLREMMAIFEPPGFSVLDVENLRLHYARTLEHWLERFESHADSIGSQFDERFVRAWRLYLSGSIAAFRAASLQLFQVLFARASKNDLPWSRAHLYEPTG